MSLVLVLPPLLAAAAGVAHAAAVDLPPAQFQPLSGEDGITISKSASWDFIELAMNSYAAADRGLERLPVDRPRVHQAERRAEPTIDEAQRVPIIQQMQQIFYEGAAYAILAYPYQLEAFNTERRQGRVHTPDDAPGGQEGSVIYKYNNIDTYRLAEPKVAAETAEDEPLGNWKRLGIWHGRRGHTDRGHVLPEPDVPRPAGGVSRRRGVARC